MDSDKYLTALLSWCAKNGFDPCTTWGLRPHIFHSGLRGVQVCHAPALPRKLLKVNKNKNADTCLDGLACDEADTTSATSCSESSDGVKETMTTLCNAPRPQSLLRVPHNLVITAPLALASSPCVGALARLAACTGNPLSETEVLALFLIEQRRLLTTMRALALQQQHQLSEAAERDCESAALAIASPANWLPYVATVPETYDTTMFWGDADLAKLGLSVRVTNASKFCLIKLPSSGRLFLHFTSLHS